MSAANEESMKSDKESSSEGETPRESIGEEKVTTSPQSSKEEGLTEEEVLFLLDMDGGGGLCIAQVHQETQRKGELNKGRLP